MQNICTIFHLVLFQILYLRIFELLNFWKLRSKFIYCFRMIKKHPFGLNLSPFPLSILSQSSASDVKDCLCAIYTNAVSLIGSMLPEGGTFVQLSSSFPGQAMLSLFTSQCRVILLQSVSCLSWYCTSQYFLLIFALCSQWDYIYDWKQGLVREVIVKK